MQFIVFSSRNYNISPFTINSINTSVFTIMHKFGQKFCKLQFNEIVWSIYDLSLYYGDNDIQQDSNYLS